MVTTVNVLHRVVIALIQLNTSSFTQLKMQMVFGKLHCNVHSVVVGMMVLSISMIFMLKMVIEQSQIEDRAKIFNLLLKFIKKSLIYLLVFLLYNKLYNFPTKIFLYSCLVCPAVFFHKQTNRCGLCLQCLIWNSLL